MRRIAVVSAGRSDFGIYRPVLRRLRESKLQLLLMVTGMHLSSEFGMTVNAIEAEGYDISARIDMLLASDQPGAISKSIGIGIIGFAQAFAQLKPDLLLVLGDRFEMYSSVVAALPFKIPVAHIHGGESTEGAIDEALRHSITKMSHLHFVSTQKYAQRVIQMGEEPWRVTVSGAPALDSVAGTKVLTPSQIYSEFGADVLEPFLLVTYHPVTFEYEATEAQMKAILDALSHCRLPVVFTYPNADTNGRVIIPLINEYTRTHSDAKAFVNLGNDGYFSFMHYARAMVGNSSSGIIEAASFRLPVVNVGNRQKGRLHGDNVVDVGYEAAEIKDAILRVTAPEFREGLTHLENIYGDGRAAERIVSVLEDVTLDSKLVMKKFYDVRGMENGCYR